ncbi:hypothetical protein M3Y98_00370200 [Aphelenchoides besseyi]|nr:hypothetical protein M3Y98_00370200 [Aphelenchoides besseyi]KAI6201801.1 hypothetical protein M3Y96_00881000 [Aphelenchoides besseyi]
MSTKQTAVQQCNNDALSPSTVGNKDLLPSKPSALEQNSHSTKMSTESNAPAPFQNDDAKFALPRLPKKKAAQPQQPTVPSKPSSGQSNINIVDDYSPPSWAEVPPSSLDHEIEVMNNGVVVGQHKLTNLAAKKSYISVGRADICDIQTNIPGSSRLHCYIQYGEAFDGRGWYIYDRGSTHGTFVNKQELPKNVYYKARFGSVIQITKGNFHLFLSGSEETTSIRRPSAELKSERNFEESQSKSTTSFEKDPMAVLSKYCEREGLEFHFSKVATDEKKGEVTYAFDLPSDTGSEKQSSFSGTGSDATTAQRNCALQVCQHLNTLGILDDEVRWGTRRNLEDNDFYDEDEDTFYDRTGQLEAQRLKRIQRHNATTGIKERALTYDEVAMKIKQLESAKQAIISQLERLVKPPAGTKVLPEEIDLAGLSTSISIKMEVSKLKRKFQDIDKECEVMKEAAEAIKPTILKFPASKTSSTLNDNTTSSNREVKKSVDAEDERSEVPPSTSSYVQNSAPNVEMTVTSDKKKVVVEEMDDDAPIKGPSMPETRSERPLKSKPKEVPKFGLLTREDLRANKNAERNKRKVAEEFQEELEEIDNKRNRTEHFEEEQEPEWVPPKDQTGDGYTKLNEKFAGRY